jgi:hypothetical protein
LFVSLEGILEVDVITNYHVFGYDFGAYFCVSAFGRERELGGDKVDGEGRNSEGVCFWTGRPFLRLLDVS